MPKSKNGEDKLTVQIEEFLDTSDRTFPIINPDRKTNQGALLFDVFLWQEIASIAGKRLKAAWAAAQGPDGVVPSDEKLRSGKEGVEIVAESANFSCTAELSKPRKNFDLDLFVSKVAKKFKLKEGELLTLAEACKVPGNPALSKRVLEAAK